MKREVGTAEHFEGMLALFESKTRATQKFVFLQDNDLKHRAKNMKKLLNNQQQNKWYPESCLLPHFEASLYILAVPNLLAHKNLWLCYYGQVNSLWLKSSVASKIESKHLWRYHLFWCWWYHHLNARPFHTLPHLYKWDFFHNNYVGIILCMGIFPIG